MSDESKATRWHVSTNRHPTTGGEEWGSLDAKRHPAGGAGTWPRGLQITWEGAEGKATAARIAACEYACRALPDPERDVAALLRAVSELLTAIGNLRLSYAHTHQPKKRFNVDAESMGGELDYIVQKAEEDARALLDRLTAQPGD